MPARAPILPRPRLVFVAALALTIVMWAFFTLYDPHVPVGPSLLADGTFESEAPNEWTGWGPTARRAAGEGRDGSTAARLDAGPPRGGRIGLVVAAPRAPYVRFSGWIRGDGLVVGDPEASGAGVLVVTRDLAGKIRWADPHVVVYDTESRPWRRFVRGFEVPPGTKTVEIIALNRTAGGALLLDDIALEPAELAPWVSTLRVLFGACWLALFALGIAALRLRSSRAGRWTAACALVIAIGVAVPGPLYREILHTGARFFKQAKTVGTAVVNGNAAPPAQAAPPAPTAAEEIGREVKQVKAFGHAALFALLGLLAAFVPRAGFARRTLVVAPVLLLYAGATEALQFLIAHRQPRLEDVVLDGVAAAAGLAVGAAIAALRSRKT